jgi:hypothetical protein
MAITAKPAEMTVAVKMAVSAKLVKVGSAKRMATAVSAKRVKVGNAKLVKMVELRSTYQSLS